MTDIRLLDRGLGNLTPSQLYSIKGTFSQRYDTIHNNQLLLFFKLNIIGVITELAP